MYYTTLYLEHVRLIAMGEEKETRKSLKLPTENIVTPTSTSTLRLSGVNNCVSKVSLRSRKSL